MIALVAGCTSQEADEPTATPSLPDPTATSAPAMESSEDDVDPIQIGTLLPSTGDLGIFGPPMNTAIDLAFELVNEAGGVNGAEIMAVNRDSGTSEQLATDAASALVNVDGVNVIVGALSSGVTIAVAESVTIPSGKLFGISSIFIPCDQHFIG